VALPSAPSSNDRSLGGIVIRLSIYTHLLLMGLHLLLLMVLHLLLVVLFFLWI
jgi:hypothetical protein